MKQIKLNPCSAWLLGYMAEINPIGICKTNPLPSTPEGMSRPGMAVMRGLVKRGLAYEATSPEGHALGIFYLTKTGLEKAKEQNDRQTSQRI
jgi:hypothetical protein